MQQQHSTGPILSLIEVMVPTATAIVHRPNDPLMILVGWSAKHQKEVLPGGKIDSQDLIGTSIAEAAIRCIRRELREEAQAEADKLTLLSVSNDPERDVRKVHGSTLRGTLAESALPPGSKTREVLARYGMPDFLFVAEAIHVGSSEEFSKIRWIDIRSDEITNLGAGHAQFVMQYRESLKEE